MTSGRAAEAPVYSEGRHRFVQSRQGPRALRGKCRVCAGQRLDPNHRTDEVQALIDAVTCAPDVVVRGSVGSAWGDAAWL